MREGLMKKVLALNVEVNRLQLGDGGIVTLARRCYSTTVRAASAASLALLWLASCATSSGAARRVFIYAKSCPDDRVEEHRRADLIPHRAATVEPSPPPDVASDPDRLRVWRQAQDQRRAAEAAHPCNIYEVSGCGQRVLYCCYTRIENDYAGQFYDNAYCYGADETGALSAVASALP